MFGSFLTGFLGTLFKIFGFLIFCVSFIPICQGEPNGWLVLVGGFALIVLGAYMKYVSHNTVRVRDTARS